MDGVVVARFTVAGEPVSKGRPRFSAGQRPYTPAATQQAQDVIAWHFRRAAPGHRASASASYGVAAVFYAGTRRRRDIDNMLKLVLDGLNAVAWADDSQVLEVAARKAPAGPAGARTDITVYRLASP